RCLPSRQGVQVPFLPLVLSHPGIPAAVVLRLVIQKGIYRLDRSVCAVSAARKTEQKVMRTMPIMYSAIGQGRPPDQLRRDVAINGASPPANGAANCDPSDAPL